MMSFKRIFIVIFSILFLLGYAQEKEEKSDDKKKDDKSPKEKIDEALKKSKLFDGILKIYQDSVDGSVKILLSKDDLDKELIYFSQINNGIAQYRLIRGAYMNSMVFKMEKKYDKIEFIRINSNYYFDPKNPLSRAKDANVNNPILESVKIESEDAENGQYLIKADDLFLSEMFNQVKPVRERGTTIINAFKMGGLDKGKSTIESINNYADNLNVKTNWVYSQKSASNNGGEAVLDARNISVEIFHSIIRMPENDYQPRFTDPRIGYFDTESDDQTSKNTVNYRDFIHRWNLVKKNPEQSISDPKTPITWWIENTTPYEFRKTVEKAVLKWNKAFEQAGFSNAMVVETQPDDATWDAGDIHYNVLRWTSSPEPRFGGYGPSFVNPLTGEILGADIMLEYVHHTNRVFYSKLYNEEAIESLDFNDYAYCSAGHLMHENVQLAKVVMSGEDFPPEELNRMEEESMIELVMHEIGHTLGLTHNMKSSYLYSPEQLYDKNFTKNKAISGSVMDYVVINLNPDPENQGAFYSTEVGPYDLWAIQYGYTPNLSEAKLKQLASQSNQPELIFGNDADDMRSPGKGMDPRVMVGDNSSNQFQYSKDRMDLLLGTYGKLAQRLDKSGEFYDDFRRGFDVVISSYWSNNHIIANWIGGVYINRLAVGQAGAEDTYMPVEYEKQKQAMKLLSEYAFGEKASDIPENLFGNYARQRRGFNFYSGTDDIKIHDKVLNYQKVILRQLLNENVLERISNTSEYGNQYKINEMLTDLTDAIFKADIKGSVSSYRQNLQAYYVFSLLKLYENYGILPVEKNAVLSQLISIQKMCKNKSGDALSKAHKHSLYTQIEEGIKPKDK